jgi:hypothetical protein
MKHLPTITQAIGTTIMVGAFFQLGAFAGMLSAGLGFIAFGIAAERGRDAQ